MALGGAGIVITKGLQQQAASEQLQPCRGALQSAIRRCGILLQLDVHALLCLRVQAPPTAAAAAAAVQ